ncbi:MAG: sensor histidine kinase [Elusimicrobiota bacterium]
MKILNEKMIAGGLKSLSERFRKLPLNYKINLLFVLAIVLPAMLLNIVLTSISRNAIKNSIFSQQREIISKVAEKVDLQVARHQDLLLFNRDIAEFPRSEQAKVASAILERGASFSEIAYLDSRGQEIFKYRRDGVARGPINRSKRKEFIEASAGRNYISEVNYSGQRLPFIFISIPASGRKGAIVAKLELDKLWQWISEVKISDSGHAFVVDARGNLIAHRDIERVLAHSNFSNLPIVRDFLDGKTISSKTWKSYRDEKGEAVVSMFQALPRLGWAVVTQIPSKEVYRPVTRMSQNAFVWTLLWTVLFLYLGFRFVRKMILGPIEILQSGAKQISEGKLDIKLDVKTGDEIEELARNFEAMASALKELEQMRQDLIRMIVHDLKSPLSGMMGSLDYLETGMTGEFNDGQKKIISLAKKSSENMLVMIQNLLDVAKMEESKLQLKKDEVDVAELLRERAAEFGHLAVNESKTLTVDAEKELPRVEMDRHIIERVLNNLISNALHHTTSGGKIEVRAKKDGGFVEISVSDNGAGIPDEYKEKIFEKFIQLERRKSQLRTGSGLGLTFCKMAVESHGGSIRVESELNKGSSFIFTLPLSDKV